MIAIDQAIAVLSARLDEKALPEDIEAAQLIAKDIDTLREAKYILRTYTLQA